MTSRSRSSSLAQKLSLKSSLKAEQLQEIYLSCKFLPTERYFVRLDLLSGDEHKHLGESEIVESKDSDMTKFAQTFQFEYIFHLLQTIQISVMIHKPSSSHVLFHRVTLSVSDLISGLSKEHWINLVSGKFLPIESVPSAKTQSPETSSDTTNATSTSQSTIKSIINSASQSLHDLSSLIEQHDPLLQITVRQVDSKAPSRFSKQKCVSIELNAKKLDKLDLFSSDPYCLILSPDGRIICKTQIILKNLNPTWSPRIVAVANLTIPDVESDQMLEFQVWDWDKHSQDDLIGTAKTTLELMLLGPIDMYIINPKKKLTKKKYTNSGVLTIRTQLLDSPVIPNPYYCPPIPKPIQTKNHYSVIENPWSFLSYFHSGLTFQSVIGLDFTASNGNPTKYSSLHYVDTSKSAKHMNNNYIEALNWIFDVIKPYLCSNKMPVLGYGCCKPDAPSTVLPHFLLDEKLEYVDGIDGLKEAYFKVVPTLKFSGMDRTINPLTGNNNLGDDIYPIIRHVFETYCRPQCEPMGKFKKPVYTLFILLVDGDGFSMLDTSDVIVEANRFPFSVLAVGIGKSQFKNLKQLDSDDFPLLNRHGVPAERDIVQFCRFDDCSGDRQKLANQLCSEIPFSVRSYCALHNITPYDIAEMVDSIVDV